MTFAANYFVRFQGATEAHIATCNDGATPKTSKSMAALWGTAAGHRFRRHSSITDHDMLISHSLKLMAWRSCQRPKLF
ncbi:MAG: hypothetical protein WCH61_07685, partial [bacterium]